MAGAFSRRQARAVGSSLLDNLATNRTWMAGANADRSTYEGARRQGKKHGRGTQTWPDGREYTGDWQDDKMHGEGTFTHPAGWSYTGKLQQNRPTTGELTDEDRRRFKVAFRADCGQIQDGPTPNTKELLGPSGAVAAESDGHGAYELCCKHKEKVLVQDELWKEKAFDVGVLQGVLLWGSGTASQLDEHGRVALYYALTHKSGLAVVRALLEAHPKAAIQSESMHGFLPLHWAVMHDAGLGVVEELLRAYPEAARVESKDKELALHRAILSRAGLDVVQAVLQAYPAAVNCTNKHGNLPLHLAAKNRNPGKDGLTEPNVIALLLQWNPAAACAANGEGELPLHRASEHRGSLSASWRDDTSVAEPVDAGPHIVDKLLKAYPAAASAKCKQGDLPLHRAARCKAGMEVVVLLLQANPAALGVADKDGKTPFELIIGDCKCLEDLAVARHLVTRHEDESRVRSALQKFCDKEFDGQLRGRWFTSNQTERLSELAASLKIPVSELLGLIPGKAGQAIEFRWARFTDKARFATPDMGMPDKEVVLCSPQMADADITNADQLAGKVVAVREGIALTDSHNYQDRTERLIAAGAQGVIFIYVNDRLPELQTADEQYAATVPVAMIKAKDAEPLFTLNTSSCLRSITKQQFFDACDAFFFTRPKKKLVDLRCEPKEGAFSSLVSLGNAYQMVQENREKTLYHQVTHHFESLVAILREVASPAGEAASDIPKVQEAVAQILGNVTKERGTLRAIQRGIEQDVAGVLAESTGIAYPSSLEDLPDAIKHKIKNRDLYRGRQASMLRSALGDLLKMAKTFSKDLRNMHDFNTKVLQPMEQFEKRLKSAIDAARGCETQHNIQFASGSSLELFQGAHRGLSHDAESRTLELTTKQKRVDPAWWMLRSRH